MDLPWVENKFVFGCVVVKKTLLTEIESGMPMC